jgi:hypothetical protein
MAQPLTPPLVNIGRRGDWTLFPRIHLRSIPLVKRKIPDSPRRVRKARGLPRV